MSDLVSTLWTPVFVALFVAVCLRAVAAQSRRLRQGRQNPAEELQQAQRDRHPHRHRHDRARVGRRRGSRTLRLPRWWLWVFYATIIWSLGYWVVYPAWPTVLGYTSAGVFGYEKKP